MLDPKNQRRFFEQAQTYAFDYMDTINERNVYPDRAALENLKVFDEPLPSNAGNPEEILQMLHKYGSPASVASTGGRYFGFVVGGTFPPVMAVKWLADVWDQLSALYVTSPITAHLEAVSERWLIDVLGLPKRSAAGFVSGTSMATLCGLAAGRYELLKRTGWDVNSKGLFGAPPIRVVLGAEAHSTVFKSLALLGLGKDRVELVPVDGQGRMDAARLPELDDNTLLILQAGNVNSGSFDPLDELCDRARAVNAWVHVDGAFGIWAAASKKKAHLTRGIEKADSWSLDAHKTLNTPYDSAVVVCKQPEILAAALQATGSYILYGEHRDGMLYTPEMSRRSRAIEFWATMKLLGKTGVEELVDGLCDRAEQFASEMRAAGFDIPNNVEFNQVLVGFNSVEQSNAVQKYLEQSGECWCGGARWKDRPVIRVSVCSWATTEEDITRMVEAFKVARSAIG